MKITTNFLTFLQTCLLFILLVLNIYGGHSNFAGNEGKCRKREQMALLKFKAELIDDHGRLSSWGSSTNCCEWEGVVCDNRTNHVVTLDLHGCPYPAPYLRGKISPSLLQLPHLQYLDLSFNDFSWSTMPKFIGSLTKLHHLNLSYSNFVGPIPHHIGNLSVLRVLDLSFNYFDGSIIPKFFGSLAKLQHLGLSSCNNFGGPIPHHIGNLSVLRVLDLSFNDFNGSIFPKFIGSLTKLQHLDLNSCNFGGPIQHHIGNLSALRFLGLGYNSGLTDSNLDWLSGSPSLEYVDLSFSNLERCTTWLQAIHKLTALKQLHLPYCSLPIIVEPISLSSHNSSNSLVVLDLSFNYLFSSTAVLFSNMSGFSVLKELYLQNNLLNGSLVQAHLRLPNLEYLDLSINKFTGTLPNLSSCPSLRVIYLSDNTFNAILKESIGNLSRLEEFDVGYNQLEGVITEAHLPSSPQLTVLDLSFNLNITLRITPSWIRNVQFHVLKLANCKLGPQFPKWLKKQNQLKFLDISNSGIFDTIPVWFWGNVYMCYNLNMSHNQIYGVLPNLSSKFSKLETIDLSFNEFTGSLPHFPKVLFNIDLSTNKFSGTIHHFCNLFEYVRTVLDLSNNLLSSNISQYCLMKLLSLPYLNLANNNLSGEIPTTNSTCRVSLLHLQNNSFRGEIPRSLMNCSELRILDLGQNEFSGEIPGWLGKSMPKLGVLILKSNILYGSLPSSICHLANLQVLDISSNKITGTVPNCVNNFTLLSSDVYSDYWRNRFIASRNDSNFYDSASVNWKGKEEIYINTLALLKMIDLSSNELTGEIPRELTSLIGLLGLNLSRNNLVGFIPDDIDQMKLLNFLDLSRNKLSGGIPPTISKLSHLGVLNLSFNNLSGRIPWDTHMQTFGASTYLGNPRLCGPPLLHRPCPEAEKPSNGRDIDSEDEDDSFITKGFYTSMALGFFVAFWVVFWTLFFNKWWNASTRKIYVMVSDWLYVQILVNKRRLLSYFSNA